MPPRVPPAPEDVFSKAEPPTVLKRDSSVQKVARPGEVPVPRLSLVLRNAAGETSVEHAGEACRIGSHGSNDVVVKDPTVSRFHCRLVHDGLVWRVTDTASSNGTWLDGIKVRDAELPAHAKLTVGDTTIIASVKESGSSLIPNAGSYGALLGTSLAMQKVYVLLEKVAASDSNVLIQGESGTGRELVAGEIVQRGPRAELPFIVVDCGALTPGVVEGELFGYGRGARPGTEEGCAGALEQAQRGTVFLREIAELPKELQSKLLRALEAREVRRVGESVARKIDVRVLSSTHRDLEREVNRGSFREDLYFRLAVIQLVLPPLRERAGDIPALVRSFLAALRVPELEATLFPPSVMGDLAAYDWPGNVDELRNHVERSVVLRERSAPSRRRPQTKDQADSIAQTPFRIAKERVIDEFERAYFTALMAAVGGNVSKAARQAGMDRMHLHHLIQKLGLKS